MTRPASQTPAAPLPVAAAGKPLPGSIPREPGRGTHSSPAAAGPSRVRKAHHPAAGDQKPAGGEPSPSSSPSAGSISPAGPAILPGRGRGPGGALPLLGAPPGQGARTWTIELPAGMELLSLNDRLHWAARHRKTQALKQAAWALAKKAKIPPLERAAFTVEYQPPDRRHRDAENTCAASGKACVDGIVAAGILEDDECPRFVAGIYCTIGERYPKGRLVLHIFEVAA